MVDGLGCFEYVMIAVAVVGSALIKNSVGVGAGIFLLPFLALALPVKIALGLGAPAMLVSDIVGIRNYWREWDKKTLLLLIPPAFLGVVLGAFLIKSIPNEIFGFLVGVFAIIFSSYQLFRMRCPGKGMACDPATSVHRHEKMKTVFFGFFGGVASSVIHAGGMVMSIYLIQKPNDKRAFVGTFVVFFAFTNFLKMVSYLNIGILTFEIILLVAAAAPLIILGGVLGNALNKKFSQEVFRAIVFLFIFIVGIRLVLKVVI